MNRYESSIWLWRWKLTMYETTTITESPEFHNTYLIDALVLKQVSWWLRPLCVVKWDRIDSYISE